ncbi:putative T2SP_E domain-containing protein [Paraburkholderia unamae]|uniref:GspE/PulE family protein n=1 Tax=Paraburkholderia unamae TaxID=219649 RepID=UPI001CABEC0C|nr:ATPase, T2SS/T4P/T4SS family [Paraburkholderia unamae]CAG9255257.1 putative T2SP_E domain-containing protein [Paraburkholderia unamae]
MKVPGMLGRLLRGRLRAARRDLPVAGGPVEPAEWVEEVGSGEIADVNGLPAFEVLLTAGKGDLSLSEGQRAMLAAVRIDSIRVIVLVTRRARFSNEYLSLVERLRGRYARVQTEIVGHSVLLALYDQAADADETVAAWQRVEGEQSQSSTTFLDMAERGVREKASDLHVEISEEDNRAELRYRIDGELATLDTIQPSSRATDAVMYAYTKLAEKTSRSEPSFNKRLSQSCNIPIVIDGRHFTLRWASQPRVGGFEVILRFLETGVDGKVPTLAELGYEPGQDRLVNLLIRSKGALIVGGDTGSGKSTTLRTAQTLIPDRDKKKIIFIEDPNEYRKKGTTEISIQRTASGTGDPFLAAMRTAMRMDPDVVVPGEIRDSAGAELFEYMIDSGHKGMTTTHASGGFPVIRKLTSGKIGMSRDVLGSRNFLAGIIFQDLVAKLCSCALPARGNLDSETASLLEGKYGLDLGRVRVVRPGGCPACSGKGVLGRTVLAEVIQMTHEMRALIREGHDSQAEEMYRRARRTAFDDPDMTGKTIFEHGLYKVASGIVDPHTMANELDETFELYEVMPRVVPVTAGADVSDEPAPAPDEAVPA